MANSQWEIAQLKQILTGTNFSQKILTREKFCHQNWIRTKKDLFLTETKKINDRGRYFLWPGQKINRDNQVYFNATGTEFVDISFTWHSLGHIPPFSVRKGVSAAWPTIPNVPGAQAIIRAPDMLRANEWIKRSRTSHMFDEFCKT